MEFTVSQLTSRLLDKLNRNSDRFTPPDLARAGFPERLIDLIVRAGEARLRDSLVKPVSKWSDHASEGVELAWKSYLRRSEEALTLPKEEIRRITESAMKKLLMAYCNPAEYIADLVFGTDSELTSSEIKARLEKAGTSHYLGRALLVYLDRNELDRLEKEQSQQVLLTLDQILSDAYSSNDWLELLSPLFELGGGTLPAGLIRQVFENKKPGTIQLVLDKPDESDLTSDDVIRLLDRLESGGDPVTSSEDKEALRSVKAEDKKDDIETETLMDRFSDGPEEFHPSSESAGFGEEEESEGEADQPVLPWVADEEEDGDEEGDEPVIPWIGEEEESDGEEDEPVLPWVADEEEDGDEEGDEPVLPWIGEEEESDGEEDQPVLPWVADEEEDADEEGDEPVLPWIGEEEESGGEEDEPVLPWVADEEEDGDEEGDEPVIPWIGEEEESEGEADQPVLPWVADEEEDGDEEGDEPVIPWIADEAEGDGEEDEPVLPWDGEEDEEGDEEAEEQMLTGDGDDE